MNEKENNSPVGKLLFLLALLFILTALIVGLRSCGKGGKTSDSVTESPASPSLELGEDSPNLIFSPAPAPVVTTPTLSLEPLPESPPLIESVSELEVSTPLDISSKGSFSSNTGTGLNIAVDWWVREVEEGFITIELILFIDSGEVNVSSIHNGAILTINGEEFIFTTPALQHKAGESSKSELCKTHVRLPYYEETMNLSIDAVWKFNGTYSGHELKKITASEQVSIP
ncbi:MAG: hypothetical protein GX025_06705 [Clostridiales bacterium]|nr:hypothetical protein [Clostridiales bacterium]